jgi:hypothetical protein
MGEVVSVKGRLSFCALDKPRTYKDGDPRYEATVIFAPDSDAAKDVRAAIKKVAEDKWGEKAGARLKKLVDDGKLCHSTKPRTDRDGEVYAGFAGNEYIAGGNKSKPTIVNRRREPIAPGDDQFPYSGCHVVARYDLWAQDDDDAVRINGTLLGVQFVKDDEAFGGGNRKAKPEDFADLGDDEAGGDDVPY